MKKEVERRLRSIESEQRFMNENLADLAYRLDALAKGVDLKIVSQNHYVAVEPFDPGTEEEE